ncbi:large ribosomal subunit protein mL53 isoform X2 [Alligator mississippiensis]|uniref:large ribosomal subunit protein mL53 isoform X2 n=1 Tax=Alligator mississippiensis TaxID=8496 RepID=UPI00090724BE|nr:large ribosomal subunit protein mL53 isoform X2 [Alligator mississippiensis]
MAARRVMVGLRAVKSVRVCFCPFETNVESTREFLHHISSKKARSSNSNCVVTTDVRHDGSEPMVDIMFVGEHQPLSEGFHATELDAHLKARIK